MFHLLAHTAQDFTYNNTGATDSSVNAAGILTFLVIGIVLYLISGYLMGKVLEKAGKPMWAGFVPIYNSWVLFEISGKPGWWALIALIPYVGAVVYLVLFILAMLELGKRFGKSTVFTVFGLILFSIVGIAILAFDESKYNPSGGERHAAEPPYPPAVPRAPSA